MGELVGNVPPAEVIVAVVGGEPGETPPVIETPAPVVIETPAPPSAVEQLAEELLEEREEQEVREIVNEEVSGVRREVWDSEQRIWDLEQRITELESKLPGSAVEVAETLPTEVIVAEVAELPAEETEQKERTKYPFRIF